MTDTTEYNWITWGKFIYFPWTTEMMNLINKPITGENSIVGRFLDREKADEPIIVEDTK